MPREPMTTTIPAYVARTQLGVLLKQVRERKARFIRDYHLYTGYVYR